MGDIKHEHINKTGIWEAPFVSSNMAGKSPNSHMNSELSEG